MARRTVENFNGFIAARPTAATTSKKSTVPPRASAPGRWKPAAPVTGNRNLPTAASSSKSTKAAPPAKKKEQRPIPKIEKVRRNDVPGKNKVPDKIKNVRDEVEIQRIATKNESKPDKITTADDNSALEYCSSNISDGEEYEDDFEEYESDFESDNSTDTTPATVTFTSQQVAVDQSILGSVGVNFPLYVEEKVEPFLEEKFEVNLLEQTVEQGLINFQTAGKRKREQEVKEKIKTRGAALMEMIKLDTVSYSLLNLPAIPYEQYIKIYGRSNTTQVQTQTHDDNAEKEIQTNEIELCDKWTQQPIILANELNCSSAEYQRAKLGVGGNEFDDRPRLTSIVSTAMDSDRVCAVGRIMLAILEQQAMERAEQLLVANKSDLDFSNGHLSPALSTVRYFDGSSVTSLEFARIRSSTEYLVTIHEVTKSHHHYVICIWCISNMENPEYILKCPNRVTSFCAIPKSTFGFVLTAHANGSICVWDLRESRLYHQQIDSLPCPLRSPSFNTALSVDQGHKSKIIGLSAVTYSNTGATDEEFPDELCSLDEDFVLNVWTIVDSRIEVTEFSEYQNAGTAPWSSVSLTKMQNVEANKNIPRYLFDGVVATCMCLNNNQEAYIGTNSGLVFRCNLGELKLWPSYYTYENTGEHFSINWLDICPFDSNYFLAACSNSKIILYRANRQQCLGRFFTSPNVPNASAPVVKAQWCIGHPGIVFGLDSLSSVHVWDVCDDVAGPMVTVPFRGSTAVASMSLTSARTNRNCCYVGLAFSDGTVEMHRINVRKRKSAADGGNDYCDQLARVLDDL